MHLANLARQMFKQNVRVANPINIEKDSSEDAFNFEASTVVGLALAGIETGISTSCSKDCEDEEPAAPQQTDDPAAGEGTEKKEDQPLITVIEEKEEKEEKPKKRTWRTFLNEIFDSPDDKEVV